MEGASAGSLPRDNLVAAVQEAFVRREEVDLDLLLRMCEPGVGMLDRPAARADSGSAPGNP